MLGTFVRKWCFSKISKCRLWPPCDLISLKITEFVDLIRLYLHTKFHKNLTFCTAVMQRQSFDFELSSWAPCAFDKKNCPKRLILFFIDLYKSLKIWPKNLYSDLLFEKVGQKKHVFLDFLATLSMDFFQNLISSATTGKTPLCQIS